MIAFCPRRLNWLVSLFLLPAAGALAQGPETAPAVLAIESALVDSIAKAEPSVVAIARVRRQQRSDAIDPFGRLQQLPPLATNPSFVPNEYGAGVVIDRRGLVLTHYHVLGEESDFYVTTADRRVFGAKIKAADPRSDLAVLAVDADDLSPIIFGDASALKKGQIVIALGNPYAIARDGQASASWGIVANLGRKAPREESADLSTPAQATLSQLGGLIQTDAKLNLGASGGALINLRGEMVGLVTSMAAASSYEQAAGFAVPVDGAFKRIVDALKKGREVEYGLLGIKPQNVPLERRLAGLHGALPGTVLPGTPADRAGLQPNDIISHVNEVPVYDPDSLMLQLGREPAGSMVRLTVHRGGKTLPVVAELAKYAVGGRKVVTTPAPAWRGLRLDWWDARPLLSEDVLRPLVGEGYVLVTAVEPDSPAAQAGLKPGDAITRVGDLPVSKPDEFWQAVADHAGDVQLTVAASGGTPGTTSKVMVPAANELPAAP